MRLKFVLFAILSVPFFTVAQTTSSAGESYNLKTAVQYAVEHAPGFDSLKRQLHISEMDQKTAQARMLPSLDFSTTHGILDSDPSIKSTPYASEFAFTLTESLYDNGLSYKNYRIASLAKNQAEINFQDRKNKLALDVTLQFLRYSLNVKLLQIQEKQFSLISRQYDLISKLYYQGLKTKNDYLRFKTEVSRGQIDVINARTAVENSKQELQKLLGIDLRSVAQVQFVPVSLEAPREGPLAPAVPIEDHAIYKAALIQKDINQLNSDIVARRVWPEWYVSAGGSYGSSNYLGTGNSIEDNDVVSWNALLTLKYNFFDWGIRSRDKQIADQRRLIQNNELESTLLELKSSLNQLQIEAQQVQANFDLSKDLLSLENTNIQFIEREYRNGKVQYLDLIAGLNSLADAEIKFYSATADMRRIRYTSLYHQGLLYDELVK